MKFNFKKIASVLTSTVMLSSTLALAAAANFPTPFVNNGAGDVAIIYGSSPLASDQVAILDINTALTGAITTINTNGTVLTGDNIKFQSESGTDKFNLGEDLTDFYTTLDQDQLALVLRDGTYMNDQNDEFDYEQDITPGPLMLQHFLDSEFNDDKPVIGFNLATGALILNYTLDFDEAAEGGAVVTGHAAFQDLENTDLEMLGRDFFISSVEATGHGPRITLLDAANTITLTEGESKTVTVAGKSYDVTTNFIEDENTASITVNGETTNNIDEGQVFKLKDGSFVGMKEVFFSSRESTIPKVEFSIGAGKIELDNGEEVQVNDEDISDIEDSHGYTSVVKAIIANSTGTDIDSITLEWTLDDDAWIAPGTDLIMPGFNTLKFSMGSWTTPLSEETTLDDDGDSVRLSTTIKDGKIDLNLLYANSSVTGFKGIGEDVDHVLVTNGTVSPSFTLMESNHSYFVATAISGDDSESYVYELKSVNNQSTDNVEVKLENLATGSSKEIILNNINDTEDEGRIKFTLVSGNEISKNATIALSPVGSGTIVYGNLLVSKEGLQMRLPVSAGVTVGDGNINLNSTTQPTTFVMNFTEENDNDQIGSGSSFQVTLGFDAGDGTEPKSVAGVTLLEKEDDSDVDVGYVSSPLATKLELNSPSDGLGDLSITYGGSESFADVFLSEVGSVSGGGGSTGSLSVSDSLVSSVSGKNLIVVGGGCINTVAASLLGSTTPLCGPNWEAVTNVGAGSFLIQTFDNPWDTGSKIATLVAGYNQLDTGNAAKYLTTQSVDVGMAGKKLVGTTATSATLVTS